MPLGLIVPKTLKTLVERMEFAELVREKLRREHNGIGAEFRAGRVSKIEWERYLREEFAPKNLAVSLKILAQRAEIKDAVRQLGDESDSLAAIRLDKCFEDLDRG